MEILLVEDSHSFTGFENFQSFMAVEHGSRILVCHRFATHYGTLSVFFLVYNKCYSQTDISVQLSCFYSLYGALCH